MFGSQKNAILPKLVILIVEIIFIVVAHFIMAASDLDSVIKTSIYVFSAIVFIRMNAMMFIWLNRGITWPEVGGNLTSFGLYYVGFPFLATLTDNYNSSVFIIAIVLFALGSIINTLSEVLRIPFFKDEKNKGKLYTGGLFKYSVHINYFGDVVWVLGFALVTMNLYALIIPAFLFCLFQFSYIPNADKYLLSQFGKDFERYKKSTATFIPFIL